MNNLLKRQIEEFLGDINSVPQDIEPLFQAISDAYDDLNTNQHLTKSNIDMSTGELRETNLRLSKQVSEQKEVQENIKHTLSLLTATLESTADGILVVDLNGKVVRYNHKFLHLWRIPDGAAESKDDNKLLAHVLDQLIDPEGFLNEVRRLYASIEEESLDLLKFKDGRVFERFSKPQRIGDKIIGRVWSFHDITERINAEVDLVESKHRLDIILNSILTGVAIIDAKTHKIVDVNPLVAELIGLPEGEIVGKVCHKFICPAEVGKCPISDLGQTVDQAERVLVKGNGREIPILKTVTPASWQGRSYFIESFIDITALKEAKKRQDVLLERVEKTNRELEDFAYIISHDLKAPLRGISTLASWISTDYADKFDQEGKEQIDLLITRVGRMHDLIEGVLQYSRIGRLNEGQVYINLNDLVPEIIDMVCPPDNIKVIIENVLPVIKFERTRIIQVFQNLISNAVKYIDKPEGWVKIDSVEEENQWVFSVSDNGPGIKEKYFDKIFQIFQSVSQQEGFESTGIGLTVTKKIVELYGGKIWVESNPEHGSTFFFSLPKQESEVHDAKYETNNVS